MSAALASCEAKRRSMWMNVIVTLGAFVLAAIVWRELGSKAAWLVGAAWAVFELSCLTFRFAGPRSRVHRVACILDELAQPGAIYALIYFAGGFTAPLLALAVMQPFAWLAEPPARTRRSMLLRSALGLALAIAFFVDGNVAEGVVALPVVLTAFVLHGPMARMLAHDIALTAERDVLSDMRRKRALHSDGERIARELHDGLGAAVMTLVIKYRSEEARQILEDLRTVAARLRNDQPREP